MSDFAKNEDAFIFQFLVVASEKNTLAQITAEVEGRAPKPPRAENDEDESEESEEEEDNEQVKKRLPSPTLMGLLEDYFNDCPASSTHHTCLVLFITESMKDLDPGGFDKKHLDWLEPWLVMLQSIIEASNLLNTATKNFFSDYTSVAQNYFRNLPDEARQWGPLLAKWREIIKVSKVKSLIIMSAKDEVLARKLGDKYTMDFDEAQAILRRPTEIQARSGCGLNRQERKEKTNYSVGHLLH
jgi:hypothetical protein